MYLEIISPEKTIFSGTVKRVKVPGSSGSFEILQNHAPIISLLSPGVVRIIDKDGKQTEVPIDKGFVESKENNIKILLD